MVKDYVQIAEKVQQHIYFSNFQQILSSPEKKIGGRKFEDEIFFRSDPFNSHSTRISAVRSTKPINLEEVLTQKKSSECIFCEPFLSQKTTEPKIIHSHLRKSDFTPISMPNLYGLDQISYVTVFAEHKSKLTELNFDDLITYVETLYELSLFLNEKYDARNVWEFINWGVQAGASQEHPHAQRGTGPFSATLSQLEAMQVMNLTYKEGNDPFETYLQAIRDSPYFIWESQDQEGVFIHAPFAPKLPHQVDIVPKEKIHNILEIENREQRIKIARSMLGVFQALYERLGVTDLNVALHQEFFGIDSNYRMHWHIYPRNLNKLAGIEVGHGIFLVNKFPEETADKLYEHYHHRER